MDDFRDDHSTEITRTHFALDTGTDVLAAWSETASQSHRNAVYRTLFSVLDGSLFRMHDIVDDYRVPSEFFAVVRDDLVVKLKINGHHSFGIVYIGQWEGAPGAGPRRA